MKHELFDEPIESSNGNQAVPTTGSLQTNHGSHSRTANSQFTTPQQMNRFGERRDSFASGQSGLNQTFPSAQAIHSSLHNRASLGPAAKKQKMDDTAITALKNENFELQKKLAKLEQKYQDAQELSEHYKSQVEKAKSKSEELLDEIESLKKDVNHYHQKSENYRHEKHRFHDNVKQYCQQRDEAIKKADAYEKIIKAAHTMVQEIKNRAQLSIDASRVSAEFEVGSALNVTNQVNGRLSTGIQLVELESDDEVQFICEFKPRDVSVQQVNADLPLADDSHQADLTASLPIATLVEVKIEPNDEQEVNDSNQSMLTPSPVSLPPAAGSFIQSPPPRDRQTQERPKTREDIEAIFKKYSGARV